MSEDYENALELANHLFSMLFGIELTLKLWGLGVRSYFSEAFNIMDFIISLFNLIEFLVLNGFSGINAIRAIRVFRTVRIIRITRIFRYI
jgi:hypothetical protein